MYRSYDRFSETDRRAIRIGHGLVIASYGAAFLLLVALAVANHSVSLWATDATQAEVTGAPEVPAPTDVSASRRGP